MTTYAKETTVPVERTRAEVERTLARFGASGFGYAWQETPDGGRMEAITFVLVGRQVRILLPLPKPTATEFYRRTVNATRQAYDQEVRSRWRALLLIVKAKLAAIESGISTIEREFLADIVLPDGRTYGQFAIPQIGQMYETGQMPALLPGASNE